MKQEFADAADSKLAGTRYHGGSTPLPAPTTSQDDGIDRGPSRFALRARPQTAQVGE